MKSYEKLLSFLRNHPFHHMLCGVFFVILGVNELQGKVEWSELLICLFAVATLVAIFFTCVKVLSKRKIHSAIFTTIFLLLVLFYAHVFFFLISISVIKFFLKEGYFIILVTLTVTGLAIYLLKTRRQLTKLNLYFNVLMIAYLVVEFTGILRHIDNVGSPSVSNISPSNTVKDFTHTPDIYFIIADAYAREDNLKKYWNYDNHVFIETLQKRGFYYVKHSKSNYDNTLSSIASTLNMEYLPKQLDINTNRNPIDTQNQLLEKIQHNKVFHKLQSEGYAIHNLSLFTILNFKQHYFDRFFYRSFYNHLLSKTLPMRVYARYTYMDHHALLKELKKISELKGTKPKAVYCHLLLPHFPYTYDSAGNFRRPFNPSFKNSQLYLNQLIYTNKLLMKTVAGIQTTNPNAIIVLASDHGYRQLENETERKKESFDNFISIYFPDQEYNDLYPGMSSVNIFKAIFSKLRHQKIELEKDKINYFQ